MKTPWKHQEHGANYLYQRNGTGFLWFDIRTGKCYTTLLGMEKDLGLEGPALILGPLTVLAGWINELLDMGVDRDDIILVRGNYNQKRNLLRSNKYKFFLLNYDVAKSLDVANIRNNSIMPREDWSHITFDESVMLASGGLQNPKRQAEQGSGRTMYWLENLPKPVNQRRVMLSGLPNPETVLNFASQYLIADGHYMGYTTYDEYLKAHWKYNKWNYSWEMKHPAHAQAVMDYVAENSCIVEMRDVHDVPENIYSIWDIPLTAEQKRLLGWLDTATSYKKLKTDNIIRKDLKKFKPAALCADFNRITQTRTQVRVVQQYLLDGKCLDVFDQIWEEKCANQILTPIIKFGYAMQVVAGVHPITKEKVDENKTKYILEWSKRNKVPAAIFSRSRTAIELLHETLGDRSCLVHGGVDALDRERLRVEFQEGKYDFFLGQTGVIKMGYDLSRADYIFYFSNDYSNNVRTQADGRTTHLTKSTPTSIIDLCTEGTRERDLVQVLRDKYKFSREFIKSPVSFLKD